jgi:uracil-DNA glycosylase
MSRQLLLDQIAADIITDNVCPDLAKTAKGLVIGDGDVSADLLFIGEAPGRQEDEQGIPFVGASGKFLSVMLESIHLRREQVYITNIVKYRPPENRDPTKQEKAAFLPYLLRQIEVIKPALIITLGRHSGLQFLPDLVIGTDHGQAKKITLKTQLGNIKTVILPLYHPAAALYNGSQRQTLIEDFATIPALLKKIKETK